MIFPEKHATMTSPFLARQEFVLFETVPEIDIKTALTVDIWILYGSFLYAFETEILSLDEVGSLYVRPKDRNTSEELIAFLQEILKKPRHILRIDLKIHASKELILLNAELSLPISLYSETLPELLLEQKQCKIKFSQIKGATPAHKYVWDTLKDKI